MENPFRAPVHHHQPPNNRRLWHLFFVAALGVSVLWLSWTLLLDDYDDETALPVEAHGGKFIDEEDAFAEDTKILNKETRLRTRKEEIGDDDVDDADVKRRLPPSSHEDDEEEFDEDEHIGEEFLDDDTKMNEEGLHGGKQRTKKKKPLVETRVEELPKKSTAKPVVVHEEDDELSPLELQRLAEEDADDDESPTTRVASEKVEHKAKERTTQHGDRLSDSKQSHGDTAEADEDEDEALVGDDSEDERTEEAVDEKGGAISRTAGHSDKPSPKPGTEMEEGEEDDQVDEPLPPPPPGPDGEQEGVNNEKLENKKRVTPASFPKQKPTHEEEVDDDDNHYRPAKIVKADESNEVDDDGIVQSPKTKEKSAIGKVPLSEDDEEEEDDDEAAPLPEEEEATEDDDEAGGLKLSKPQKAKETPLDGGKGLDTDLTKTSKSAPTKPATATASSKLKPTESDEDEEEDDDILGPPPGPPEEDEVEEEEDEQEEEEEIGDNKAEDADKLATAAKPNQSSKPESIQSKPAVATADEEENEEEISDDEEGDDNVEKPAVNKPITASKVLPESMAQKAEATADASERNDTTSLSKSLVPCESIRKRSDCDVREGCKWKYPKSETTGFFCQTSEACTDPSIKHKSKCLSLPKCDWVRVSSSAYGCRDKSTNDSDPSAEAGAEMETADGKSGSEDDKPLKPALSATTHTPAVAGDQSEETTITDCEVELKKSKCIAHAGCNWVRVSSQPTKYGCRQQSSSSETDEIEEESPVDAPPHGDGKAQGDIDDRQEPTKLRGGLDTKPEVNKPSTAPESTKDKKIEVKDPFQVSDKEDEEESVEASDAVEADEASSAPNANMSALAEKTPCNTVRIKSMCQLRTDCYWKYPVSYSTGKYCTERVLSISVTPEKAQLYESVIAGKVPFADVDKIRSFSSAEAIQNNVRFKQHGTDWKRHKSDVSCALHPECMNKDNVTVEFVPKYPGGLAVPPTYVRAQCCTQHPQLRGLFFQIVDFLNREGIPWWLAGSDLASQLFLDGYLLPWTTQVTIEFAVFGSKTAADWAATRELRANLSSYATTKTRILRSTKNEFASKLLQFNSDPQHLPNSIRACAAKFVPGGSKKSSATSSYSSDWLKSERSGKEECYVVSKSSKIPSSKTPVHFIVSHVDELEDKGPSIKLVPRILRTASIDSCVQAWRPGTDYEPVPVNMIFPTVPCLGQGKFQGFTEVTRCPRDTYNYFAWQNSKSPSSIGSQFITKEIAPDLSEFRKWTAIDFCARGLNKGQKDE